MSSNDPAISSAVGEGAQAGPQVRELTAAHYLHEA